MSPLLQAFIFFFGAVIGSFVNAVLWRLRTRESFIFGRSYCPACRHELSAVDLIPILSWLMLGGRCRYCRKPISPSYLIIETVMGALFLMAALRVGVLGESQLARLLFTWYGIAVMVIVFVYDLRYMMILHSVTLPAAAVAFAANWAMGASPARLALAAAAAGGFFYLQYVLSKGRWIGGGDAYLGLMMGAFLGWPAVLVALFLAYVSGAMVSAVLLLSGRRTMKSQLPLGTFLAASSIVVMLWGERLLDWYLGISF
jgi:prepilin signal peptidase PulO-like enzyme (type II secretory pathway)